MAIKETIKTAMEFETQIREVYHNPTKTPMSP